MARFAKTEDGDVRQWVDVDPPKLRLRAQDHRVFFRIRQDELEIVRVRDRKEAYRRA